MLKLLAVSAAIISSATAFRIPSPHAPANLAKVNNQNQGLCVEPTRKAIRVDKAGKQFPLEPPVCPSQVGQLWYICGEYGYNEAADACAAYGWRLAMVTEENRPDVVEIVQDCQAVDEFRAWVAGADGFPGDPCAYVLNVANYVGVIFNAGTQLCSDYSMGVVCEEMPQATTTIFNTFTDLITTTGATTTTSTNIVTRTIRPYHPTCTRCPESSSSSCSSESSSESDCSSSSSSSEHCGCNLKNQDRHREPKCYGQNCLPVCRAKEEGIRVLLGRTSHAQAAIECAKYGWSLMDFTYGRSVHLAELLHECSPTFPYGFLGSYNGLVSNCTSAQLVDDFQLDNVAIGIPVNSQWCTIDAELLPICQTQCPFDHGEGLEAGQISYTTTSTEVPTTVTVPTTTQTITENCTQTVYIRGNNNP